MRRYPKPVANRYPARVAVLVLLLAWCIFGKSFHVICSDGSRLATIESLVHRGTFDISDSMFISTCDKIRVPVSGDPAAYYSDKTPFFSLAGAGIYWVLHSLGWDFRTDLPFIYRILVFCLVVLPIFLIIFLSHLYLRAKGVRAPDRWAIYVLSIFGTLLFPYAMVLNNHVLAAALILTSYVFLENPMQSPLWLAASISGLASGLAVSTDLSCAFFALPFFLLFMGRFWRRSPRAVLRFFLFASLALGVTAVVFRITSGSWFPYVLQPENYLYAGSAVPREVTFGGGGIASLSFGSYVRFLWHATLGYRGIFSHSLGLILGFAGLIQMFHSKVNRPAAVAILVATVALLAFTTFAMPISFGGSSFGFRYMIPWMPLISLFTYSVFPLRAWRFWIKPLIGVSLLTNSAGVLSPWLVHAWDPLEIDKPDFLSVHEVDRNPYLQLKARLQPYEEEIETLRSKRDKESLLRLSFLYYQNKRPDEALGYLQKLGETPGYEEWHCHAATIFSQRGIHLPDLEQKHWLLCPSKK
jgi:hypothetical protein